MDNPKKGLSIRGKTILTISVACLFFAGIFFYISEKVVFESYLTLENNSVLTKISDTKNSFKYITSELGIKLADWSSWDDVYKFVQDKNEQFIQTNLQDQSFSSIRINAMVFLNNNGEVVYSKMIDLDNGLHLSSQKLDSYILQNLRKFVFTQTNQSFNGIISLDIGNLLVYARPILKSDASGPIMGTILIGKLIDQKIVDELSTMTQTKIEIYPYNSIFQKDLQLAHDFLPTNGDSTSTNNFVYALNSNNVAGYYILYDINKKPIAIVKTTIARDIYKQGLNITNIFLIILIGSALLFGLIIFIFINQVLISRLYDINEEVSSITNTVDVFRRLKISAGDEIGKLELSVNSMLDRLFSAQTKERESIEKEKFTSEQLKEQMTELQDSKSAIINLLEDIENEKKQIEETVKSRTKELSDEKSRLTSSLNSLSFGFVIVSMEGSVVLSNPILSKILDITESPANIEELANLFKDFDFTKTYRECVDTQETIEIKEIKYFNKYLKLYFAPVVNINKIIDYVVIVEDITEAKISELSKDEFFAVASHELRTPLTAIRGNSEMILDMYSDKITDKDVKEMISDIDTASVRLINLVNNFLEVSRLEQGKIDTHMEAVDIDEIIKKVVRDLSGMAETKRISLIYNQSQKDLPKVMADKSHVEEILVNVISNAIKYTNKGNVVINVEPNEHVMNIKIADTGVGIEEKNQMLLFRKFQQANDKVLIRSDSNSTGLGLYITKLLLQNMGGEIKLESSSLDKGSVFVFTLQLAV